MRAARRPWLSRLLLTIFGVSATLFFLEVAVRVEAVFDRNYLDAIVNSPEPRTNGELTLGDLIRPNADDLIVYELRPNLRGRFMGQEVSLNSLGMRDLERSRVKAPGTFRMAGLGDSHMFGWGVAREDSFLSVLESLLNQRIPGRHFECWNLAVPGYNSVQEVEAFAAKADTLQPDLIVISFVANDMDLPNFLADRPNFWTLRKSFLRELVRRRTALLHGKSLSPLDLYGLRPQEQLESVARINVPARFRPLLGTENMIGAYRRLGDMARSRGIPAVLVFTGTDPTGVEAMMKVGAESGFRTVDPTARITRYLAAHELQRSALAVGHDDPHVSALTHRLIAEALFDFLVDRGLVAPRT